MRILSWIHHPLIVALAAPALLASSKAGLAQTIDSTLWSTNGPVYAVACDGGTIYLGGLFTYVGPATGCAAAVGASTGAIPTPYPRVEGVHVHAVAPDGAGGWYLGGEFTAVSGQPRHNLAHFDAGGTLTAWNPSPDDIVLALAVAPPPPGTRTRSARSEPWPWAAARCTSGDRSHTSAASSAGTSPRSTR